MNTARTTTIIAALVAFIGGTEFASAKPVTIEIETGGTIKVGDYKPICNKKPKQCGSDYELPKPKPKPTKLIRRDGGYMPAGYTPIGTRR